MQQKSDTRAGTQAKGAPSNADEGKTLLVMVLACSFLASFAQTMMNIALPEVADKFGITLSMANWLIVGYTVVAATSITLEAFLLGKLGLRRLFFVGAGAIALGSGLALIAPDFPTLVVCRLVQAVGTGLFYPTATSVISQISPQNLVGVRLALNSGAIAVGLAVSPVVSGLLLTYFGWRTMFIVPCAFALVLMVVGWSRMHNVRHPHNSKADIPSVFLSLVGLGALVYGLGEIAHDFVPSALALVAGLVVLALFARRQLKVPNPLLNLHSLGHPLFTIGIGLNMLGAMVSFSLSVLLPLYYEGAEGMTAFLAGVLLLGPVLVNAAFLFVGGKVYDRRGIWPLVPGGFVLALVGLVGVIAASGQRIVWVVVLVSVIAYAGVGFVTAPSKTAGLAELPPSMLRSGSALNSTFVQIGEAVGSALFVGVLSSDVLHATAAGVAKSEAYAAGFAHTLFITLVIAAAAAVLAFFYARTLQKRSKKE
ncbi:MFS transporter [Eggerthella sp. YY7918]|uniref:MFS transporter n=1 Tax=Eggerthella sp. (strain YY7918) TaxID=502558 RepID=UPI000217111D|nr:MFS transporter [Eggerthella sp. YY7918]BAK45748.1 hypothetical protein EGYY_27560 [Eggerthella sp. YY7918]